MRSRRQRWLDRYFPKPEPDPLEPHKQAQTKMHAIGQMSIFDQLPQHERAAVRDGASFIEAYRRYLAAQR